MIFVNIPVRGLRIQSLSQRSHLSSAKNNPKIPSRQVF